MSERICSDNSRDNQPTGIVTEIGSLINGLARRRELGIGGLHYLVGLSECDNGEFEEARIEIIKEILNDTEGVVIDATSSLELSFHNNLIKRAVTDPNYKGKRMLLITTGQAVKNLKRESSTSHYVQRYIESTAGGAILPDNIKHNWLEVLLNKDK